MNRHRIAAAIIVVAVVAVVAWTWWTAPSRGVEHVTASSPFVAEEVPDSVPGALTEIWAVDAPKSSAPFTVDGLALAADDHGVTAVNPSTGDTVWSYHRDVELCEAMVSDGRVVAVFRGPAGCGEVTSLNAADGTYAATRRGLSTDEVEPVRSNDRSGIRDGSMVELWRHDLVRTVEYGDVEASSEPGLQPHPGCDVVDALTRGDVLAVVNDCPDGHRLVLQAATPEESRSPEIDADIELPGPGRLVALGQLAAAVLVDGEVRTYSMEGAPGPTWTPREGELPQETDEAASLDDGPVPVAATADLPHHMTWFTGSALAAFRPDDLSLAFVVPNALGTGTVVGDELLVPVPGGLTRVDWETGEITGVVPVARGALAEGETVTTAVAGDVIVEKRGDRLVGLRPE
ncbi:PQQ-binding-like beta-propeller repeat protein [uncultured Corynebacterium sp.]|uniref:Rv3212 family protein n=1 Tax=uncultured Corynebacterium sp. TaxID=159447 RepID=UPI0025DF6577|nr:PQQ-binding-like beta-propeller repeat protein [uncultured Corynebacterium sp.]